LLNSSEPDSPTNLNLSAYKEGHDDDDDIDDILGTGSDCLPSASKKCKSVVASDQGEPASDQSAVKNARAPRLEDSGQVLEQSSEDGAETNKEVIEFVPGPGDRCFALETLPGKQAVMYFVKVLIFLLALPKLALLVDA
jgi:hypothetical protein